MPSKGLIVLHISDELNQEMLLEIHIKILLTYIFICFSLVLVQQSTNHLLLRATGNIRQLGHIHGKLYIDFHFLDLGVISN